jgi:hypothetical protein
MGRPCSRVGLVWVLALIGCAPRAGDRPKQSGDTPDSTPQVVLANPPTQPTDSEWLIIGGQAAGRLTSEGSEAELRRHYGGSVKSTRIQLGEGETTPGTVLFPGDSLRRAEIVWHDTVKRSRPARLILRGSQSRWQAGPGISLGTSLEELERLNGRPFTLAGFGWDYGGVIVDWSGGALDSALAGVKLYLDPGPVQYESAPYSQVLGDRDYSSSLPAMRQLNPRVAQIFVDFE